MIFEIGKHFVHLGGHHAIIQSSVFFDLSGVVGSLFFFGKDVRKEFKAENLPFVIGVMGTGITAEKVGDNAVSLGQRAAAKTPEFKGNVAAVESYQVYDLSALEVFNKGWKDHFAEWCAVGSDRPYHYLGSGKFFVRFGNELATSMTDLIDKQ